MPGRDGIAKAERAARLVPFLAAAALAGMASSPARADPDALWTIVSGECVPAAQAGRPPAPCSAVEMPEGPERGYALLKDREGVAQYLLIPTARIPGIEDPRLLEPGAPNYFALAWGERARTGALSPRPLRRQDIGLAVNSVQARSQNELHIHIDCLSTAVRDSLEARLGEIGLVWSPFPVPLGGKTYLAMRVDGEDLGERNPFQLLAHGVPGAAADMGSWTIAVAGVARADGAPGFVLLGRPSAPEAGDAAEAEDLLDHACSAGAP